MAEIYFIPSQEEANRFSEAYLDAQREYHERLDELLEGFPELYQRPADEVFKIAEGGF